MTEIQQEQTDVPKGWAWTTLEDIALAINPGFPSGKWQRSEGQCIPHLRPMNIDSKGAISLSEVKYIQSQNTVPLMKGDILFNNTNSPKLIGKTTYIKENTNWAYSNHMTRIKVHSTINPSYVSHYLHHLFLKGFFFSNCLHHVNQASVNTTFLKEKVHLPLAPIAEQERIVTKIEELFSFLDAGVESLRKVRAQLKRYRQAVLKYAFDGKLTEEWRRTHKDQIEPAQKLLERLRQERKKDRKYKESPNIDQFDLPQIPQNWAWTILGETLFLSNERYNPKITENERFVGLEHIESGTGKLLGFGKSSETRSTKNRFNQGDLLYGKLRPYLNKVWVANFNGVCSTDILVFKKNEFVINMYLAPFLTNQDFVEYARQHMSGVQHPRISYQALSQYVLPLPPFSEQLVIAEEIQRNFLNAERVDEIAVQSTKQAEALRQSILKIAFRGELVPQNPADEPADKLLQRIKAERFSNKPKNDNQLELSQYVK